MEKTNYDLIIRDPNTHAAIDKRNIRNKEDFLSALEKYQFIFSLTVPELMRLYDLDIDEVEKYVRNRREQERTSGRINKIKQA